MRTISAACLMVALVAASVSAQGVQPAAATMDDLKATIFRQQAQITDLERRLAEETSRRASLELKWEFPDALKKLDPGVQKVLGVDIKTEKKPAEQKPPQ